MLIGGRRPTGTRGPWYWQSLGVTMASYLQSDDSNQRHRAVGGLPEEEKSGGSAMSDTTGRRHDSDQASVAVIARHAYDAVWRGVE